MSNYQLYKTNVLLGGQMKWNMKVSSFKSNLYIDDFYLSPISDSIVYNKPDRDVLNYSHSENIKDLYNTISSDFFNTTSDSYHTVKYPVISNEAKDTYCSTYDAGVKRVSNLIYEKSISLFCPVWLEDFGEKNKLIFEVEIYTKNNGKKTIVIDRRLDISNESIFEYHNKFINYFKTYIKHISKDNVIGDDLINIDFKNKYSSVEGIDVRTGNILIKDTSLMLPNLLYRLRPMMDTDSIIINTLSDNFVVCKQLFNFNILFDFEDIIPASIRTQLKGQSIYFDVRVKIDDKIIGKKCFDHDYSSNFLVEEKCPLDYFEDYNAIQLIDKNKITPNIIHWSLCECNDYIFNIYPNMYKNTNLWTESKESIESRIWCNGEENDDLKNEGDILNYIKNDISLYDFTTFSSKQHIVNNVKYLDLTNTINLYWLCCNNVSLGENEVKFIEKTDMHYVMISKEIVNFNFKKFTSDKLTFIDKDNNKIEDTHAIYQLFKYELTSMLRVDNSISKSISKSPDVEITKEINYKKCITPSNYIFRYFGKIKPTFIDFNHSRHYEIKKITTLEYNENWEKYIKTNYLPLYPSINYFYINEINSNENSIEPKWYFDGNILLLNKTLEIIKDINVLIAENQINLKDIIKTELKSYYNITKDEVIEYIYSMYNITYTFDYDVDKNDKKYFKYIYNIKLNLK